MRSEPESTNAVGERLVDLLQVAGILSVSKRSVQRLIASGALPQPVKVGHASRLYQSDVDRYLAQLREQYRRE